MMRLLSSGFALPLVSLQWQTAVVDCATQSITHSVVPSKVFEYMALYDEEFTVNQCEYVGAIRLSHPMSVGKDDEYFGLGIQMLKAAHISLDAINMWPRCGVHLKDGNYSLHLQTYGDNSDPNMTAIIGNAIVNETDFMLAGYSTTMTEPLTPIAQAHKRILVTAGSSRTAIHANKSHVFACLPPSESAIKNTFETLSSSGAKTMAYVSKPDTKVCSDAPETAALFNVTFLNGTMIPKEDPYESYLEVAKAFKKLDPDVVMACFLAPEAGYWNKAMREVRWSPKAQVYGLVVGQVEFETELGTDLAYTMGISSWDRALPPTLDGATGWTPYEFDAAFEQASLWRPVYQVASQATAVSVLVQAMERVGDYRDTWAVQRELATGYFPTVYGNISFDENGQSVAPGLLLQYDRNGTLHVLAPSSLKSNDFEMVYPTPSFDWRDCEFLSPCVFTNGTCAEDGTCDCQVFEAASEGVGASAQCVIMPPPTNYYLPLAISLPIVALVIVGAAIYVHMSSANQVFDDSTWKIQKSDLLFDDPPNIIGRGAFGEVFLAEYRGTQVAVRRLLAPKSDTMRQSSLNNFEGKENFQDETETKETKNITLGVPLPSSYVTKSISTSDGGKSTARARQRQTNDHFIKEMRYLNRLRHPTIITILGGVLELNEEPMLVMEYMQHGSLHSILHNETMVMDDEILLPILKDISSGCRYLHSADPQIVHGDLKTSNILVDDKLRAKVADFELGTVGSIRLRGVTGTPLWMAPELLRGETMNTPASDVFSMGVILYECFSRKDPYEGEDHQKILARISDPKINLRPQTPKDCPAQIASLMADCWVSNPDERPSFEEVDSRLKRMVARTDTGGNKKGGTGSVSLFDIFPRHVAEALRDGKKVEPEHRDSVTIFFSDIVGFTSISAALEPGKVASMLNRLYTKFDELSNKHDVFKVETIGDAYMAVTNLVTDQAEDHALRIAAFAVDAVKAANETLVDPEDPTKGHIGIRCGFHTGAVVADVVGTRNPRYCLFGDTVNTASRMESNSEKNRILCSQASADILQEQQCRLNIAPRGEIPIKGKGQMLTYWINENEGAQQ